MFRIVLIVIGGYRSRGREMAVLERALSGDTAAGFFRSTGSGDTAEGCH